MAPVTASSIRPQKCLFESYQSEGLSESLRESPRVSESFREALRVFKVLILQNSEPSKPTASKAHSLRNEEPLKSLNFKQASNPKLSADQFWKLFYAS